MRIKARLIVEYILFSKVLSNSGDIIKILATLILVSVNFPYARHATPRHLLGLGLKPHRARGFALINTHTTYPAGSQPLSHGLLFQASEPLVRVHRALWMYNALWACYHKDGCCDATSSTGTPCSCRLSGDWPIGAAG